MKYAQVIRGEFVQRPNRFIARVRIDGKEELVHVKNTGRCKELLLPGVTVWLSRSDKPQRKTKYDLIGVEKKREEKAPLLVNMDSQIPNAAAEEWLPKSGLFSPAARIRREVFFGNSRFDFYIEDGARKAFMEVKGVTLEHNGIARFPDAPTVRGVKHIRELIACLQEGYEAYILFVVQMKEISCLRPNDETHKAFGDALREAAAAGVKILAVDCLVTPYSLVLDAPIRVNLEE
ncbi:MAG: DNA/RNA nuclease SfsA [Oscillospiraceae bacterium]|nr:DNA/RNA nuclease SfsA [Oscillospiraceae bacterium]